MEDAAKDDAELEVKIIQKLRNWKRATIYLGVALFASVASVVPFLAGHSLHDHWDSIGKNMVLLSMILLPAFCFAAGTAYNMWSYLRSIQKINNEYAKGCYGPDD
jgi:hypothetical protein